MRLTIRIGIFVMILLLSVSLCKIFGQAQSVSSEPTISVLDSAVNEMDKQLRIHAQSLKPMDNARLVGLLDKQRRQLDEVKAKYQKEKSSPARHQLAKDLNDFFTTGAEIQKLLKSSQGSFKATEYSPDPSQCAEHCSRTCGYDSVGEKVCWYTCYYCCGKGGC